MLKRIVELNDLKEEMIIAVYNYGSRVYGTNREDSDHDFIVVMENGYKEGMDHEINCCNKNAKIDLVIFTEEFFIKSIENHCNSVLECLFLPPEMIVIEKKDFKQYFKLNLSLLRKQIRYQ